MGFVSHLPTYPQEAAKREAAQGPPGPAGGYASWGQRVGAYLLDVLIVFGALIVVGAALAGISAGFGGGDLAFGVILIAILAVPIGYYVYFVGNERGQTYGRRVVGIQVRSDTFGPVGYGRALGRYLITFVFGFFTLPLIIDYLWPLWDSRNQTLHDKAASTVVVRV